MSFRLTQQMKVIGWLTLLLCLWSTGDLVVDLVFEEPDVTADASTTAEELGNAAEHLLMPSQRAGHSAADIIAATPAADPAVLSTAFTFTDNASLRAHRPITNHLRPVPCPFQFSFASRPIQHLHGRPSFDRTAGVSYFHGGL